MEQSKVDNQFIRRMNDLQLSLQNDEDLTVICADTFSIAADDETSLRDDSILNPLPQAKVLAPPVEEIDENSDDLRKPMKMERQTTPPISRMGGLGCFTQDVFESDPEDTAQQIAASRSHPFMAILSDAENLSLCSSGSGTGSRLFPAVSHPSPNEMRAGARAWRERHGRDDSSVIDFRTGMSGHMALLSSHAHPHGYLETSNSGGGSGGIAPNGSSVERGFPKMSSHTGLTMANPMRGMVNSLTCAFMGETSLTNGENVPDVRSSGSM
jgi:hypothetical protein